MNKQETKERKDIYQLVTARVMEQLEQGVVPWVCSWSKKGAPRNLTSKKNYRGINFFLLGFASFDSRYWLTFRQALALGGNVRKGEKGGYVVYWHWRTAEELEALRAQDKNPAPCYPIYSTVFNWAQCDGLAVPQNDTQTFTHTPREEAERILREMPNAPKVEYTHGNRAGYALTLDTIAIPHTQRFAQSEAFYAVLFHELAHATGHASRLNRLDSKKQRSFGSPEYSFEELVAEMTAAFLCAHCGIENRVEQSAAYIEGWLEVLRQDKKILLEAATAAQQAADYILGKGSQQEHGKDTDEGE